MNFLQSINTQPISDYIVQPAINFAQEHSYITTATAAIGIGAIFAPGLILSGITASINVMQTAAKFATAHPFITAFASVPMTFGIGVGLLGLNATTEISKECMIQSLTIDIPSSVIPNLLFGGDLYSIGVSAPFFIASCMVGEIGYTFCNSSDLSKTVCSTIARGVIGGSKYIEIAYAENAVISNSELIISSVSGFINNGGYALMSSITKMSNSTFMPIVETLSSIPIEFFDVVIEVVGKWSFGQELGENINVVGYKAFFGGAMITLFAETFYAITTGKNVFSTFRENDDFDAKIELSLDSKEMCLVGGNETVFNIEV